MKTRTKLDLILAIYDDLPESRRRQIRAGFLTEFLPTLPAETQANFREVISEAEYQAGLINIRREAPRFKQWLVHEYRPHPDGESFWDERAKQASLN